MKTTNLKRTVSVLALKPALAAATLALLVATLPAQAAGRNPNAGILPVDSNPYGKSYGEWSGAWWRWAYSIPADVNPVSDTTGEFAAVGQSGPVWFLAGNFGGTTVRTATAPAGKGLFFPIINTLWINIPELGDDPWSDEQRAFARSVIAPFVDNAFDLSCTIDGVTVANIESYRAVTPDGSEYFVTLPEGNITGGFLAPGTYGPCVDDGIYLMLAPLKPGLHTIRITAASAGSALGDFALDVTYNLTVK
jgi:hypothetical protein